MARTTFLNTVLVVIGLVTSPAWAEHALEGAAAMIAAGSPIAESLIQSSSDVQQNAQTNAWNYANAELVSNTTKTVTAAAVQDSAIKSTAAVTIAAIQQQGATDRAKIAAAALDRATDSKTAAQMQDSAMNFYFQERLLQIQAQQAQNNFQMQLQAINGAASANGMSLHTQDSGAGLAVQRSLSSSSNINLPR